MQIEPAARPIAPWRLALDAASRRLAGGALAFAREHWLALANGLVALLIAVATAGVVLLHRLGADDLVQRVMRAYHLICMQEESHSYHLWGQQFALCERNLAIFAALLLGGLGFGLLRDRLRPLSLPGYLVLALPMAIDGFTQLWGWRSSDVELRTLTGALFGLGSLWYLYPALEIAWRRRA